MTIVARLKLVLTVVILSLLSTAARAQKLSYIYIQGDKEIPFYAKLNGVMAERYFRNHIVLPGLKKGSYDVEILFEQNRLPPIDFRIEVPDNRYRGFLLCKRDSIYTLYDIDTKTCLLPVKK